MPSEAFGLLCVEPSFRFGGYMLCLSEPLALCISHIYANILAPL